MFRAEEQFLNRFVADGLWESLQVPTKIFALYSGNPYLREVYGGGGDTNQDHA